MTDRHRDNDRRDNDRRDKDRRYTRAIVWGMTVSIVGHALLFLVFSDRPLPQSPFAAAGERMGDIRAAAGGGLEAIQLSTPTRVLEPPPPIPEPTPDVMDDPIPEPELEQEDIPAIALDGEIAAPGSEGPAEGPGLAEGAGEGDGGTEAEGRFRVAPPAPKGVFIPPMDRPAEVRGKTIDVWVFVTATGEVVADSTRLHPSTGHRGYDRRLRESVSAWIFEPARKDGEPVAEWYPFEVEL